MKIFFKFRSRKREIISELYPGSVWHTVFLLADPKFSSQHFGGFFFSSAASRLGPRTLGQLTLAGPKCLMHWGGTQTSSDTERESMSVWVLAEPADFVLTRGSSELITSVRFFFLCFWMEEPDERWCYEKKTAVVWLAPHASAPLWRQLDWKVFFLVGERSADQETNKNLEVAQSSWPMRSLSYNNSKLCIC